MDLSADDAGAAENWWFLAALAFEGSLIGIAALLTRWLSLDPPPMGCRNGCEAAIAVMIALPPLPLLWWTLRVRRGPLARVREEARMALGDLLAGRGAGALLLLATAAGLGEELLFRGVLQTWCIGQWGTVAGIVAAAAVFGGCHALSIPYAVYAATMGGYFGAATAWTNQLAGPILAHIVLDFAALLALRPAPIRPPEKETPSCPPD